MMKAYSEDKIGVSKKKEKIYVGLEKIPSKSRPP